VREQGLHLYMNVMHELVLHLYMYEAHALLVHHRDGNDLVAHRHDVRAARGLELHRCTCAVREQGLHLYMNVMHELVLRLYMYEAHELLVHHRDGNDLVAHRHDVRAARGLELHRCTCAVRELDDHLRSDHEFRLAFRHPCAVVSRKDSKRHYYALRHGLQRAEIRRDYAHLDREVHEGREIRPLPPWNLA
jgi:hypothetical protein